MSSPALGEGFRELLRDPQLFLMEVMWRWSFGAIAILVCTLSAVHLLGAVPPDRRRIEVLAALPPFELAQGLAAGLIAIGSALLRAALLAALLLAACWIVVSAVGRYLTLK